jgi:chemotaxis protein methyltransferase CheR
MITPRGGARLERAPGGQETVGEVLTSEEFNLFRNLIYQESGMVFRENKKEFLEYRLARRMKATAIATPYWYYRFLTEHRVEELPRLFEELTINETSFFRNVPQIELFRNRALPEVAARKARDFLPQLRIWSAGCSTGEEPYTLAIVVREVLGDRAKWDTKIFASDLSMSVLSSARRGRYPGRKVRETVPAELLRRYFVADGEDYVIADDVRQMVTFDFHNLKHEHGLDNIDVIFCRNVMIYFDLDEQKRLIDKFYRSLRPGGFLFIGHSESLHGMDTQFQFVFERNGTAYRKPDHG